MAFRSFLEKASDIRLQASGFWWVATPSIAHTTLCKLSLRVGHAGRPFLFVSDVLPDACNLKP